MIISNKHFIILNIAIMAGLPHEQIKALLRQICGRGAHNLPEPALHVRPDSLLAVLVAVVSRLKH